MGVSFKNGDIVLLKMEKCGDKGWCDIPYVVKDFQVALQHKYDLSKDGLEFSINWYYEFFKKVEIWDV